MARILIVDDDRDLCDVVCDGLSGDEFTPTAAHDVETAVELMHQTDFAAVALDVNLTRESGLVLCRRLVDSYPGVPIVIVTAQRELQTAIEAIRAGAYDFVAKPFQIEELAIALRRAVQHHDLVNSVHQLRKQLDRGSRPDEIIGDSRPMMRIYEQIEQVATAEATVLITGESGTGKELIARAIHDRSARSGGPFVALNCAAVVPSLLESELFGHVKGAFTTAQSSRPGLFLHATHGTLFLDEIGEMPIDMQVKLLRVLQEGRVRHVGDDKEVPFDTRIIAATNRDLEADVEDERFREDLFYRINVLRIEVPPLRARGADVIQLAQHMLEQRAKRDAKQVKSISPAAAQKLLAYDWPGNVRELQNCMERAAAVARHDEIIAGDLPDKIREHGSSHIVISGDNPEEMPSLAEMEGRYIRRVLEAVQGNRTYASRVLGIDRRTLYRKLERMDVLVRET